MIEPLLNVDLDMAVDLLGKNRSWCWPWSALDRGAVIGACGDKDRYGDRDGLHLAGLSLITHYPARKLNEVPHGTA